MTNIKPKAKPLIEQIFNKIFVNLEKDFDAALIKELKNLKEKNNLTNSTMIENVIELNTEGKLEDN